MLVKEMSVARAPNKWKEKKKGGREAPTQRDGNTTAARAPRLRLFNGARAPCGFGQSNKAHPKCS